LVIALEVAEHLDPAHAATFVSSLVNLGPIVAFSAAIPDQGGTHHVNEQWPEYWAEIFKSNNYVPVDCVRSRIWKNPKVAWWYAQNLLLFVDERRLKSDSILTECWRRTEMDRLSLVHPRLFSALARKVRDP